MKRSIIEINNDKCTGCGMCIPNCAEGALQIIDGKCRLVSDLMCDGLGACIGHCPEGAMTVIEREAVPYDEKKVMVNIVAAGTNTIIAHLKHMDDHKQGVFLAQAIEYLEENNIPVPEYKEIIMQDEPISGCPSSRSMSFDKSQNIVNENEAASPSALTHWPVQMHLISPNAAYFHGSDLLIAADCTAFAAGDFHNKFLAGKTLAIACPKLDDGLDIYEEKIKAFFDEAKINTLTLLLMQVPCCGGLLKIAQNAAAQAKRKVPIKCIIISAQGDLLSEEWI